jgi:hypothetical protein
MYLETVEGANMVKEIPDIDSMSNPVPGVKRILVPFSGNLQVLSLYPVINELCKADGIDIECINTDQPLDHEIPLNLTNISSDDIAVLEEKIIETDLVLSGLTFLGDLETNAMKLAKETATPYVVFIADVGIDIVSKKIQPRVDMIPDHVLIADPRTIDGVRKRYKDINFVEAGNPQYDRFLLHEQRERRKITERILYMDIDFERDFEKGLLPSGPYKKEKYLRELYDAIQNVYSRIEFSVRLHPRSDPKDFEEAKNRGFSIDSEEDSFNSITKSDLLVSSYSTSLFEASIAGIGALSYQPWESDIRSDIFGGRVDIAKTPVELEALMRKKNTTPNGSNDNGYSMLFNPGYSKDFIYRYVLNLLD